MILRIEIPQELIRQDAEIVIKVSNRNNALGYVIEKGSEHDALQIAKEDTNVCPTLGEYVRELTQRLYKNGKYRSADIYMCTLSSFMRFRKEKDLLISQLDSLIMEDYESYLRKNGLTLNTISFYMKRLRAIYNKALEQIWIRRPQTLRPLFHQEHPYCQKSTYSGKHPSDSSCNNRHRGGSTGERSLPLQFLYPRHVVRRYRLS